MARVTVEGEVASVNGTGSGFRVVETWEGKNGQTGKRYFTVWFPRVVTATIPNKGDKVKAEGFLSVKVSDRDPRFCDVTVNEANITILERAGTPAGEPARPVTAVPEWETVDQWGTNARSAETPPDDPYGAQEPAWNVAPIPDDGGPY